MTQGGFSAWASAQGEASPWVADRNVLAMAKMIHQNVPFTAAPRVLFNIYLDSTVAITGGSPCNA